MKYFGIVAIAMMLAPAESRAQQPLVVDTPMVHDPVMAYENGKYYLYCTGHGIAQMTSTDRKHWTLSREGVLKNEEIPAWTHDSVPGFETHIWAPDVIRFKNKWYLAYSCSTFGKNTSAIGLLSITSLSDKDGWKDEGCLVASKGNRDKTVGLSPAPLAALVTLLFIVS
jgi:arabinan endo-1,5-alpha-L-arabinosidase